MLTLRAVLNNFSLYAKLEPGGVSVSTQSSSAECAVHWMAALGDLPAIQLLAKAGSDLSAQDHYGNTALHVAVSGCHAPATQGADYRWIHSHVAQWSWPNARGHCLLIPERKPGCSVCYGPACSGRSLRQRVRVRLDSAGLRFGAPMKWGWMPRM